MKIFNRLHFAACICSQCLALDAKMWILEKLNVVLSCVIQIQYTINILPNNFLLQRIFPRYAAPISFVFGYVVENKEISNPYYFFFFGEEEKWRNLL